MILSEFNKLLVIYLVAFLLNCFISTLITHLTFFLLRHVCFGYHFKNLYVCITWSIITFPVTVYYLADLYANFSITFIYILFCTFILLVYMLSPKGTKNHPIINQAHRKYLRKKMKIYLIILVGIFCLSPLEIKVFILYGVLIESIMLILQTLEGENCK